MSEIPAPITPYLEPAAKDLAEATAQHPRIYEIPPEEGRKILADLQSDQSVPRLDCSTSTAPAGCSATSTPTTDSSAN
ncbi:hypothetical protein [Flexivirga oryzae]|uniref:Uncharacterized protein n=1 Tax=Flexivirga oryzae TaxID=1794944 RepID=A0A839N750_9MICO|nr:hypothetical protein [Flexivirga oryzae]MBB2893097.1 hypothetical protein [Flexivirga oryzae]